MRDFVVFVVLIVLVYLSGYVSGALGVDRPTPVCVDARP